jgi:hypothetical protein
MRVTIGHRRSVEEVKKIVDRSIDDAFTGLGALPIQIVDVKRTWEDNTMTFSMNAKVGFLNNPVRGTVLVTASDVTVDADLGPLGKLLPEDKAKALVESRVKGLIT